MYLEIKQTQQIKKVNISDLFSNFQTREFRREGKFEKIRPKLTHTK